MAYIDMRTELRGSFPKLPWDYTGTIVNRAWRDVRRQNLWSFQLFEANWTSPGIINSGTATVTQGLNYVTVSSAAAAAINAQALNPLSPIINRQFRVGISTIYNIFAWDTVSTLTLDRIYAEPSGTNVAYSIFQCYYPAPMQDFLTWISIRDIVNYNDLVLDKNREWVDQRDPQRTWFYLPTHCVYYQQCQNTLSPIFGWPLFELWGQPQYQLTYQLYGIRKGTNLVNPTDSVPFAIGEDAVMALSRKYGYEWGEANKGDSPRDVGSDYRFLIGVAEKDYNRLFASYRRQDRETVNQWFQVRRRTSLFPVISGYYNSIASTANPGAAW